MVTQVNQTNRRGLDRNGFGLEFQGFADAELPLISHKDTNIYKRGVVALKLRIAKPGNYNDGEAVALARKAAMGLFPWPPGEKCLERVFKDQTIVNDPFTNTTRVVVSDTYKGCKWCRESMESQGEPESSPGSEVEPSYLQETATPGATTRCLLCDYAVPETDKNGSPRTKKQRQNALRLHNKKHTRTA